jgi:hypothetical protein
VLRPPLLKQAAAEITADEVLRLTRVKLRVLKPSVVSVRHAHASSGRTFGRAVPAFGSSASATICPCGNPRIFAKMRQISYLVKGSAAEKCRMGGIAVPDGNAVT